MKTVTLTNEEDEFVQTVLTDFYNSQIGQNSEREIALYQAVMAKLREQSGDVQ